MLVKTPALSQKDVAEINYYKLELNEEGNGRIFISKVLRGKMFEQFLYLQHEATIDEQKQQIRGFLPFHSIEILSWDFQQSKPDDPMLTLNVVVIAKNQMKRIGENMLLSPIPVGIPAFDIIESRVFPARINYPICKKDS